MRWTTRFFALVAGLVLWSSFVVAQESGSAGSYDRGLDLYRKRNFRAAMEEFDKVLEAEPDRAEVRYLKGYCQYMMKQYSEAVQTFGRAFQANPQLDPRTIYQRAASSASR